MADKWDHERRLNQRRGLLALVWMAVIVWSVFLLRVDPGDHSGSGRMFAVIVRVMGSVGILFALFLVTRPLTPDPRSAPDPKAPMSQKDDPRSAARWALVTITAALAIGGAFYKLTENNHLHQSALFFVGIPAVLAITLALTPKAKSATGMIVKGITLALLLSGVLFYEGVVCIAMAAPLFYLVGVAIGYPIDRVRRKRGNESRVYSVVGIAMLFLSVEGITPATSFDRQEVAEASRVIEASPADVRTALAGTPGFYEPLPFYLRLGFPRPIAASGQGLDVGDRRVITFGTESPMEPMGEESHDHHYEEAAGDGGTLTLEVVASEPGRVVFEAVEDRTAFTHWIDWGLSVVTWEPIDPHRTSVTWTLRFERRLSPAWYFGPWQRYAATRAAGYLIDTVAAP